MTHFDAAIEFRNHKKQVDTLELIKRLHGIRKGKMSQS